MNLQNSQEYYGEVLQGSDDLRTDACTMADAPPPHILAALANVHEEVKARYYGCGLVAPAAIKGARILDLGSGSGQDAYVLAQLVGPEGEVVGVDVTASTSNGIGSALDTQPAMSALSKAISSNWKRSVSSLKALTSSSRTA